MNIQTRYDWRGNGVCELYAHLVHQSFILQSNNNRILVVRAGVRLLLGVIFVPDVLTVKESYRETLGCVPHHFEDISLYCSVIVSFA